MNRNRLPENRQLRCPACGAVEFCNLDGMLRRLAELGKTRIGQQWEGEILFEVFRASACQMTCRECGERGLLVEAADDELAEWPETRACAGCRKPIPRERLEAIPGTTLCARCQSRDESGADSGEVEYCPNCGFPMRLQLAGGRGPTHYVMRCTRQPPCRR